jgi:sigma-B regulation protein RsbU (phosphoserine phosphatase)
MSNPADYNRLATESEALRRQQELDQRVLSALYTICLTFLTRPPLRSIFEMIHTELAYIFPFDACYIAFCDEVTPDYFRAALLVDEGQSDYLEDVQYGYLTGKLVTERVPLLFDDLHAGSEPVTTTQFGNKSRRSRSWLGIPLLVGGNTVGIISIQSYQPRQFTDETRDLLLQMGNVIAVALDNVRLLERQERLGQALETQVSDRTGELAALSAIASMLVRRRSLAEMLDQALLVTLGLFQIEAGNVRLLNAERDTLVLSAARGFSDEYRRVTSHSALATSPLRDVIIQMQPQTTEVGWHQRFNPNRFPREIFPEFESALSVPLVLGSTVIGSLSLFGTRPRRFADHEIDLAQVVANQIAIVVENDRLLSERDRQISELRALSSVNRAAATARDLPTLLRQVYPALKAFLPIDAFSLVTYDRDRQVVIAGLSIDEEREHVYWQNQPPPADSLAGYILHHAETLYFSDLPAQIDEYPDLSPHVVSVDWPARSFIGLPLPGRDGHPIGTLSIQSHGSGAFTRRDVEFIQSVASQVALHVQLVRLLAERERQIVELEAIGRIGAMVTASYDVSQIFDEVGREVLQITSADIFYLLVCEPETRVITHALFVEDGNALALDLAGRVVVEKSLTDWILTRREPLLFQDLHSDAAALHRRGIDPHPINVQKPVCSWAGVPLVARDGELIGVLSIQDYGPYRYDSGTIDFLTQVASHVSQGVQKVRLFEERERQAHENARLAEEARAHADAAESQARRMELVHRISALLSSRLDQQEILDIASRELVQLFWADHSGTVLFTNAQIGTLVAEYPQMSRVGLPVDLRDNLLFEELRSERRPVVISDIEHDPRAASSRETFRAMGITTLVVLPLISRERVLGSISLDSFGTSRVFSADELEVMASVATSIAIAVDNAQLFAAEQAQRRTAETLREIARVISSTFVLEEVLQLVLVELKQLINYDTASIMLREGAHLRIVAESGWPADQNPIGAILPIVGSAAGEVLGNGVPLLRSFGREDGVWARTEIGKHINCWLGVPLIVREEVRGVLNIDSRTVNDFGDRDIELAASFANHAAVAIENARLYQESVARVEQELEIARRMQANLFPRSLPNLPGLQLAATCLPAYETGGDFYDLVQLGATRIGVIVGDVSGKSLPAAMLMAAARSTARSEARNHEWPWQVLTETNLALIEDVPRNAFVALSYATIDTAARRLVLANGGQLTPILRRSDGTIRYLDPPEAALPLGVMRESTYCQLDLELDPVDTLIFFTDGVVEARDQARDLFGFERLERLVQVWGHLPPSDLIDRILGEVRAFTEGMPVHDDLTIVVARFN